jgi:hypothetical protein
MVRFTIASAAAVGRWRIRALFGGAGTASEPPEAFSLARADGGHSLVRVATVLPTDTAQLDLVLSEPLEPGVVYVLSWQTEATEVSFVEADPSVTEEVHLELDLFGRDLDWLEGDPTPDGDCPVREGLPCLVHDLVHRAALRPGELVQLPQAGAGLPDRVNGPSTDSELRQLGGRVEAEWRADDRVDELRADVVAETDGSVHISGRVKPIGIVSPIRVDR